MLISKRNLANRLRVAAEIIEKYGWRKGDYGNAKHGFCALGAVRRAAPKGRHFEYESAASRAFKAVPENKYKSIAIFNDTAVEKSAVTYMLRNLARRLEHGLQVNLNVYQ